MFAPKVFCSSFSNSPCFSLIVFEDKMSESIKGEWVEKIMFISLILEPQSHLISVVKMYVEFLGDDIIPPHQE